MKTLTGTLYICATPIGNLEDVTYRVIRILQEVDVIAAEDTRISIKLLNHYEIKTPLTSYHEHNKNVRGPKLIAALKSGKNIALVTDAGLPLISDPGADIVCQCRDENIPVTVIPGASAFSAALVLTGFDASCFTFFGFLPKDKSKKRKIAEKMKACPGTILLYEAPHHLAAALAFLAEELGGRRAAAVREITKIHEEVKLLYLPELAAFYSENAPKGEFVIVIENHPDGYRAGSAGENPWSERTVTEHVEFYENEGHEKKEAMKLAAKDRGVSKSEIYREFLSAGAYDLAVSNPPYFKLGCGKHTENKDIAAARDEQNCTLSDVCAAANYLTRWGGSFILIQKPDRLVETFSALTGAGFEPKRIRFVQHKHTSPPNLVLVEGRRGGKKGLKIEAPLVLTDENGGDSAEARRIYHRV